jgi:hypothetical protein
MAQRSKRGRGTVFWDADRGSFVGQLSLGRDPETHARIRPKVFAATEQECWDQLDELRQEARRTGAVAPRDVTVGAVLAGLMASPPAEWVSPLTLRGNADRIAKITAALGKVRLHRLTVGQVERMPCPAASAAPAPCCGWRSAARSATAWCTATSPSWPTCRAAPGACRRQ